MNKFESRRSALSKQEKKERTKYINHLLKKYGFTYLGGCTTPKLEHSKKEKNVSTYGIYLASHTISGYEACPESNNCKKHCLYGSGITKLELRSNPEGGKIQNSRIRKTKLFFEDRQAFMQILCYEIDKGIEKAEKDGMLFAVRLNCTSDLNLLEFTMNGENIFEIYPDVQFYDYTKVFSHVALSEKYSNYDLTFSYSGMNWRECELLIKRGYRIAVVFEGKQFPATFCGYPVINGVRYDARFMDCGGVIVGLEYKDVANDYPYGRLVRPDTSFVIKHNDSRCIW